MNSAEKYEPTVSDHQLHYDKLVLHSAEEILGLPLSPKTEKHVSTGSIEEIEALGILSDRTIQHLGHMPVERNGTTHYIPSYPHTEDINTANQEQSNISAEELYNSGAASYKETYADPAMLAGDWILALIQNRIFEELRKKNDDGKIRALDVGCGAADLIDRHPRIEDDEILGVDISGQMILQAYLDKPYHKFVRASITQLELIPENLDEISSHYGPPSYLTQEELEQFYEKSFYGLKKGGYITSMPYTDQVAHGENVSEGQTPGIPVKERQFLPLEKHLELLEAAGFVIKKAIGINFETSRIFNQSNDRQLLDSLKKRVQSNEATREEYDELLYTLTQKYIDIMIKTDTEARNSGKHPNEFRHMVIVAQKPEDNEQTVFETPKQPRDLVAA